jgi:D-lactate dehydrogenase
MKTYVFSVHDYELPFLRGAAINHELIFSKVKLSTSTARLAMDCDAVSIFTSDDCSGPVIEKLHQMGIQHISLRSAGYDHVDINKAKEVGISVANVPDYSPYSVAEHAVTMLMAFNRKVVQAALRIRNQDFRLDALTGFDVHGKTIGIIGVGKIGLAFARIMNGFGASILAYDPVVNPAAVILGIRYVSLEELLQRSDIISVHCPLNDTTKYLLARPQFAEIKKGCILINTSRGGIVNTLDLIESIESGRIGAACLDVYENEAGLFFEDHRANAIGDDVYLKLSSLHNVLITAHQAFLTVEALRGIAGTTIYNLDCWQRQERSPNELGGVSRAQKKLAIF